MKVPFRAAIPFFLFSMALALKFDWRAALISLFALSKPFSNSDVYSTMSIVLLLPDLKSNRVKLKRNLMTENRLFVSPIADPLASDKMSKKLIKLIKKGMKEKLIVRGVKETVKAVRKGGKG